MRFRLKFTNIKKISTEDEEKKLSVSIVLTIFIYALLTSYFLYIPQQEILSSFNINEGKIINEDIIIRKDINIKDREKTQEKKNMILKNLTPVYRITDNTEKTKKLINDLFTLLRNERKSIIKNKSRGFIIQKEINNKFGLNISVSKLLKISKSKFFTKINLTELIELLGSMVKRGILYSKSGVRKSKDNRIKVISKDNNIRTRDIDSFYDLKSVKEKLINFLNNRDLTANNSEIITELLLEFAEVNVLYSDSETEKEKNAIGNTIDPVLTKYKKGDIFLAKNHIVNHNDIYVLEQIEKINNLEKKKVSDFYFILIIIFSLFLFINKFYRSFEPNLLNSKRLFLVTISTLTLNALIARISIFIIPVILNSISLNIDYNIFSIFYAIPFGFSVLIIAFTFNLHSSIIFSFLNAIISAIICNWDFHISLYVLIGNLSISLGIEYYRRLKRSTVLKVGLLWLLPTNLIMILLFNINKQDLNLSVIVLNLILGVFSAIASSLLANFIIPLWESLFGLLTEVKLNELANLSLPVFREMMEKAPGTYHHSQMVASLAEEAGNDLKIPQMLLTSMALYHDIGKIDNPEFFTENHSMYKNPHLKITPKESAKMIKEHISNGIERAKKLKLPDEVTDAILQHHGTKVIKFFYDKAKEENSVDIDKVQIKDYRYSGKKPQNIENGIIMLADQVEAASKSLSAPSEKEIRNVIRKIIDANIYEGQFDECDGMTLKSLNIIAGSFLRKLSSIYHTRISYPGFDFKDKNDRNNQ